MRGHKAIHGIMKGRDGIKWKLGAQAWEKQELWEGCQARNLPPDYGIHLHH